MNKIGMSELKISLLISIGIIIVLIIVGVIYVWKTTGKNPINQFIENVKDVFSSENNENEPKIGGGSEDDSINARIEGGGGGSGGGGSGGSSDGETSGSGGCVPKQIAHSLTNPQDNTQCLEYIDGFCIDKLVNCSLDIQNLDDAISGNFEIQLIIVEEGKQKEEAIDTQTFNLYLEPQEMQTITGEKEITSIGENGLANQNINCAFNTITVPIKEPCP